MAHTSGVKDDKTLHGPILKISYFFNAWTTVDEALPLPGPLTGPTDHGQSWMLIGDSGHLGHGSTSPIHAPFPTPWRSEIGIQG